MGDKYTASLSKYGCLHLHYQHETTKQLEFLDR